MSANRSGHMSAEVITTDGSMQFRVTDGLDFYQRANIHCIEADNGQGTAFYVYLPKDIQSDRFDLGITEGSPMVIHVTGNSEAVLSPGTLELTVGGDAQFAGRFSGTDANGLQVSNGSFRLENEAGA
ncbi:AbrB/MazE/SpoVT family DNA-binding domain-containing protein [Pseudomonas laurylsulfatiphila]|uniref:AbrB/MazE/SpoVT family DNA-binding domain-containing protein n=1 Tax=Pseudomonas laurylsulfatiphila TaxID=2011015 RepID=UPI003D1B8633